MHITHIADHNYFDPDNNSGIPYWISKGLEREGVALQHLHLSFPDRLLPPFEEFALRLKQYWLRFYKRVDYVPGLSQRYAKHLAERLQFPISMLKTDAILTSMTPMAAAYLETKIPIVYWSDSVFAGLANFYPEFRNYHQETMWDCHFNMANCLMNASLLIFSSQWAARNAYEFYGIPKNKIQVVPFGANLDITHTQLDVKAMIKARSKKNIRLLFVGKSWYRKGGDIVLAIAEALYKSGHAVEVALVGSRPNEVLPSYVKCYGQLSKKNKSDVLQLKKLYAEAHFLFVPSRAEAYGIVFCEANAFGVPCLTTQVGGIPEIVKDSINGMKFSLQAGVDEYCDYILSVVKNDWLYEELALSAFNEYETRLNWGVASKEVKRLIAELIA